MVSARRPLLVVLGDQLFPLEHVPLTDVADVFMAEDHGLCTRVRHHQQKLVLFLAAMRSYRDELRAAGARVTYHELDAEPHGSYEDRLLAALHQGQHDALWHFEVDDRFMERRLADFAGRHGLFHRVLRSPKFLCDRATLKRYFGRTTKPHLADFYRLERVRLGVLLDGGRPTGGRWSFDSENRKRLPRTVTPPPPAPTRPAAHVEAVQTLVAERFGQHPGRAADCWLPTTRSQARDWLDDFLATRFRDFGAYEDAITTRSATVFHSVLTPALNVGLLTPREVLDAALAAAARDSIPLNSVEGFVRQLIGWREFVHGVYREHGERQAHSNFFAARRGLTPHWYDGSTGIPPLDDTIRGARQRGWSHHIERLMVVGNLMTLCEIAPALAHGWFMEMYVDSADWVMGPNVYGMGLYSDGGLFATKPYICGSNYLLKMSDYDRGPWCDVVDGLYWRFIELHLDFFRRQPRLAVIARALTRLSPERRRTIGAAAERFLEQCTVAAA